MSEDRKSRLMITHMVLENFKSYAGIQDIGPFHKRFSSIVGPNGSGKSNVIDALLFVFGKKAAQLRLKKVSELIHKSSSYPNLDYAKVVVHFQLIYDNEEDEDSFEIVPGSEFSITRIAQSNNESKYLVNESKSTFTQVGQLLRGYGVDLDNNRFLILQGEVEQIAMMKPKGQTPHEDGLLEYLEDIIGSNKYIEQIEQISTTLEGLNEVRLEKVNRLKIAEREKNNLADTRDEAERFLQIERDIRQKKNQLYQILLHDTNSNIEKLTIDKERGAAELEEKKAFLKIEEQRLKKMETEHSGMQIQFDKFAQELERSKADHAAYDRRRVKLQEEQKHVSAQMKKLSATIAKEKSKAATASTDSERIQKDIVKNKITMSAAETRQVEEEEQVETLMAGLRESTAELRSSLEGANEKLIVAERKVATIQTEKEKAQTELDIALSRVNVAEKSRAALEEKYTAQENEIVVLKKLMSDTKSRSSEIEAQKNAIEKKLAVLSEEEKSIQTSVRDNVARLEDLKSSLLNGSKSSDAVTSAIMKATKVGGSLHGLGIRGRLGDLGTISPEYDIAISSSCGMLDYIVVDTATAAEAAINFLRTSKQGRGNFIALDQIGKAAEGMKREVTTPSNTSRLFDLIAVSDEAVRPAFYLAVKDTLVAADLNAATSIAYEGDRVKWRVVTLDGKLIDMSGAMTGGGDVPKSGGMRLSSTKGSKITTKVSEDVSLAMVNTAEESLKVLQSKLQDCRSKRVNAESELDGYNTSLHNISLEQKKSSSSVARVEQQLHETKTKLTDILANCKMTNDELRVKKQMESTIASIDASIDAASPDLNNLRLEVKNIQEQIFNVGGPRLKRAQLKLDATTAQIDQLSAEISKQEVELVAALKTISKCNENREKEEESFMQASKNSESLVIEISGMEEEANHLIEAINASTTALKEHETAMTEIKQHYDSVKAAIKDAKTKAADFSDELSKCQSAIEENKKEMKAIQKDLEKLRHSHDEDLREYSAIRKQFEQKSVSDEIPDENAMEIDEGIAHLAVYSAEQIEGFFASDDKKSKQVLTIRDELKEIIVTLESARDKMRGSVNMNAIADYLKRDAECRLRMFDLEEATAARNSSRKVHEDLRRQRLEEFMAGFGVISLKLKEMYQMITLGGDAELELVDSLDPFSEGVVFSVRPPKKSWKNITNLSGGEKTLSSLALVFALHHYKPTPLYVMDEIDAALDFKNVSIVANYIKERTKNAQFIIISLRNNMFELADRLVGIYKTHDATKSVTINPKAFVGEKCDTIVAAPLTDSTNFR